MPRRASSASATWPSTRPRPPSSWSCWRRRGASVRSRTRSSGGEICSSTTRGRRCGRCWRAAPTAPPPNISRRASRRPWPPSPASCVATFVFPRASRPSPFGRRLPESVAGHDPRPAPRRRRLRGPHQPARPGERRRDQLRSGGRSRPRAWPARPSGRSRQGDRQMCLGIPGKVVEINDDGPLRMARATSAGCARRPAWRTCPRSFSATT